MKRIYLRFFGVIGFEGKAFNYQSVFEEEDLYLCQFDKLVHSVLIFLNACLFGNEIQLLDPACENLSINLFRKRVSILRALVLEFFVDGCLVEAAFILTCAYPLQAIVSQELLHLPCLLQSQLLLQLQLL